MLEDVNLTDVATLLYKILRISLAIRVELTALNPPHLCEICAFIIRRFHEESLVAWNTSAKVFDEISSQRHLVESEMLLLQDINRSPMSIVIIGLLNDVLVWISLDQMIRRISNLLVLEGKRPILRIAGIGA